MGILLSLGIKAKALIPVMIFLNKINCSAFDQEKKVHSLLVYLKGYYLCPSVVNQLLYRFTKGKREKKKKYT